jgi:hypothetical protein
MHIGITVEFFMPGEGFIAFIDELSWLLTDKALMFAARFAVWVMVTRHDNLLMVLKARLNRS